MQMVTPEGVLPYEQCRRFINRTAHRVVRRLHAAGAHSVQFEDVASEMAIAWCRARDHYDASLGVPFIAYLQNGIFKHINRFAQKEIDAVIGSVAIDQNVEEEESGDGLHSRIADESIGDPDALLIGGQFNAKLISLLSPTAQQFLKLLMEPPVELVEELRALRRRAEYARSRNMDAIAPTHVNFQLIGDFMDLSAHERRKTLNEIHQKVASLRK